LGAHGLKGLAFWLQVPGAQIAVVPAPLNGTYFSFAFGCTSMDWAMNDPLWAWPLAVPSVSSAFGATTEPVNADSRVAALVPTYTIKKREPSPAPTIDARNVSAEAMKMRVALAVVLILSVEADSRSKLEK
jgi:hypothetical protein